MPLKVVINTCDLLYVLDVLLNRGVEFSQPRIHLINLFLGDVALGGISEDYDKQMTPNGFANFLIDTATCGTSGCRYKQSRHQTPLLSYPDRQPVAISHPMRRKLRGTL